MYSFGVYDLYESKALIIYLIIIHCKSRQSLTGVYGLSREFSSLALFVDEKERFKSEIDAHLKALDQ